MDTLSKHDEFNEHILVCISPSPSNPKVIMAAAKMAEAFHATLTALYVKPTDYDSLAESNKIRLQQNIQFAERHGATVTTIIGDDVPLQVSEYAHISDTTKIVIGRSGAKPHHIFGKMNLTEQLIINAPDVDVYIIPDSAADLKLQTSRIHLTDRIYPTLKDTLIAILLLIACTGIGWVFRMFGFSEANIITVFILGVLIISVVTVSPLYSAVGSLASVLLFNWFFTEPIFSFHTYEAEYAVTFGIMLISSLITGTLANKMKQNAAQSAREAFRTKVLLDTNQLLQKADKADKVIDITARQIITLLDRDVIIYHTKEDGALQGGTSFNTSNPGEERLSDKNRDEIAEWVFINKQTAGFQMEKFSEAKAQYHPICLNSRCYGVLVILLNGIPMETFENSVFMSILGECALALENLRNAAEKEQASVLARNEQLRSNILRSISHDIRTPLTSISGNASTLLSHYHQLDEDSLERIFSDIYDDSEWLVDLVENLLSISRIENGQMDLHLSLDIMSDVIDESLKHVDRNIRRHNLTVHNSEDILLVNMDSRLIMQVLINLINNAIKNTREGSDIMIESRQEQDRAIVTVKDNGPGIPDELKDHIFEMFYTGHNKIADGRRGLGLGLALCKAIIEAHGGTITLKDNVPSGCIFAISLPVKEVEINE